MTVSLRQIAADIAILRGLEDDHLPTLERLLAPVITGIARDLIRRHAADPSICSGPLPIRTLDGPIIRDPNDPEIGRIPLPSDFMALATLRMEGWSCDISHLIMPEEPEYALRSSPWPEISGSKKAPRCYLIRTATGECLEFRRTDPEARCLTAVYHPLPTLHHGHIDIPESLYHSLLESLKPLYNVSDSDIR